jgi:hypothetical protein
MAPGSNVVPRDERAKEGQPKRLCRQLLDSSIVHPWLMGQKRDGRDITGPFSIATTGRGHGDWSGGGSSIIHHEWFWRERRRGRSVNPPIGRNNPPPGQMVKMQDSGLPCL